MDGKGVGRLSQALISRFDSGVGIDISPRMIELASKYNTNSDLTFRVNSEPWLASIFDNSIDFIYSNLVLQHMHAHLQRAFLTDFMRVLVPGGIAAFQIPTGELGTLVSRLTGALPAGLMKILKRALGPPDSVRPGVVMEMHVLPESAVVAMISAHHGRVLACPFTNMTEPQHEAEVVFLNRKQALERARRTKIQHYYLSQFFFVRKDN